MYSMVFQFTLWHLVLGGIEMSNQCHLVFIGLCIIHNVLLDSGALRPRCLLFLILHRYSMAWGLPAKTFWSLSNRPEDPPDSPKMPPWLFLDICQIFQKLFNNFFSILACSLPNDGTNELSKDGFDGIALKVIFQGRKGQIGPFSHIDIYYSVVPQCCLIVLHHVASLGWCKCCPTIQMVCGHSIGNFEGHKGHFGPLWSICTNISETVHVMTKSWYETHIVSHVWSLSWPHDLWPWITFKGQIKVI